MIEIIVGLAVLFGATRVFGYIAMLWLWAIAVNLISTGSYYDIAVSDILLGIGAYSLARVTEAEGIDRLRGTSGRVPRSSVAVPQPRHVL